MKAPSLVSLLLATLVACSAASPPPPPAPSGLPTPAASSPSSAPSPAAAPTFPAPPERAPLTAAAFPKGWPYTPPTDPPTRARGMVSTDASLATEAGQRILSRGGNAVDAAVATAFALAVVYPAAGNIGGGGFLVARVDGKFDALDFRETAPIAATPAMYLKDGKPTEDSRVGALAVGVPGSVAGLWEAHKKLGKLPWKDVVAPAITLARDGFIVDEALATSIAASTKKFARSKAAMAIYMPNGKPVPKGARLKNPELAAALSRISDKGAEGFYEGRTAELVVAEMKRMGGLITMEDLRDYKAKWRTPIELDYRGYHIASMPPPSSGGVTLGMICDILDGYDLGASTWHGPEHLHRVVEAMRRAFAARNSALGDPDFVHNPVDLLLSRSWADAQRATILPERATPSSEIGAQTPSSGNGPHTTHLSVVDAQGNAVALTTTLNHWFGSGVGVAGAGFMLNNEMDDFAIQPGTPNSFGLVQGEPNLIAPRKRMLSSMTPTIVLDPSGELRLVVGAAGGPTIINTVFQIISNVVDFGFDPVAAVYAPRIHHQHLPDEVLYEKDGLESEVMTTLGGLGYTFRERAHIADAPSIGLGVGGWIGANEPRRRGSYAAGW